MKTIHYAAFFLGILFFSACHKKDITAVNAPFIKTDKSSLTEVSDAVSDTIVVTSNIDWTVTLPSWVHSKSSTGPAGTRLLILSIDANSGTDVRNDKIVISASLSGTTLQPVTIPIAQGGSAPFIIANRLMLPEDSTGQQDSIVVTSNANWTLSIPANATSWITADRTSGTPGSTKIHFTIAANTNNLLQSADVLITSGNSSLVPLKITIYQAVNYQITGIKPSGGFPGDTILITGTFGPNPNVTLNGAAVQVTSSDQNSIYFIVPNSASYGQLTVTFGTSVITSSTGFVPYIFSSFTDHGQVGDRITINGGFGPNATVKFNGIPATNVTENSSGTQIVCTVPVGAQSGPVKVYFGQDSLSSPYDFQITNVWLLRKPASGGLNISQGIAYSYNGSVYWGLGQSGSSFNNTIYNMDGRYNWNPSGAIASSMSGRTGASVEVFNNYVYLGLGFNGTSNLQDWWQYDPSQPGDAAWTQLTNYPAAVNGAIPFVLNGIGYVAYGNAGSSINQKVYRLDQLIDGAWYWTNAATGGQGVNRSVFSIGTVAYFGGGYNNNGNLSDFHSFDPSTGSIATLSNIPGTTISNANETAPAFSYNGKGYIIAHFNQLYQYDPGSNSWTSLGTTPNINYAVVNGAQILGWDNTGAVYEYIPNY